MHDLPPEFEKALTAYKAPFDLDNNTEVLEDWGPIFDCLKEMHRVYPDWRFGQMIANLTLWASLNDQGNTYDLPDECLLKAARKHLATRRAELRTAGT